MTTWHLHPMSNTGIVNYGIAAPRVEEGPVTNPFVPVSSSFAASSLIDEVARTMGQ